MKHRVTGGSGAVGAVRLDLRWAQGWALGLGLLVHSMASVAAADIAAYGVIKEQRLRQIDAGRAEAAATSSFLGRLYAVPADFSAVDFITVVSPGVGSVGLPDTADFVLSQSFGSAEALHVVFRGGTYTFAFETSNDGTSLALIEVPATVFPPAPLLTNYVAAQSINAVSDFVLEWNEFSGATANDFVQVRVLADDGTVRWATPRFGEAEALPGTARQVTLPAGTLDPSGTYRAEIGFVKGVARDTTSYPGAEGWVAWISQTEVGLRTVGLDGGDAPRLLFVNPPDVATQVATDTVLTFTFSKPMRPTQAIRWTGDGVVAARVQYRWPQSTLLVCSYPGGWPAQATIGYELNPAGAAVGLVDTSGNALPTISGRFQTREGTPTPTGESRLEIGEATPNRIVPLRVIGRAGAVWRLESSADLRVWTLLQSLTLDGDGRAAVTIESQSPALFFRTVLGP